LAAQPGGELSPVSGIGALGVVGLRRAGIGLGGLVKRREPAAQPRGPQGGAFVRAGRVSGDAGRRGGGLSGFVDNGAAQVRWALGAGSADGGIGERLAEAASR
jgi:hypothetical protein